MGLRWDADLKKRMDLRREALRREGRSEAGG